MFKKFLSLMIVFMMIVSMSVFIVNAASTSSTTFTKTIKSLGNNTLIDASLMKKDESVYYSKIKISSSSEVGSLNVWIMNSDKDWISEKTLVYANDTKYKITYKTGKTITTGNAVCFWGEQSSVLSKSVSGTVYPY